MMTDIMTIQIASKVSVSIAVFQIFYVFLQSLYLVIQFYRILEILNKSIENKVQTKLINSVHIDKHLISANYINLSNILYKRLTKGEIKNEFIFMIETFGRHFVSNFVNVILKMSLLADENF